MVQQLKDKAEWKKCLDDAAREGKTVIVDFTATWCGPCKMIGPVFVELAKEFGSIMFVKVDVDENEDVAADCGIQAMPTFQVYQNGKKVDEFTGANQAKLRELVEKYK